MREQTAVMSNRSATKNRARANPPTRMHPRASNRAVARARTRRELLRRRLMRLAGILLVAAAVFAGGAGTGVLVMKKQMESRLATMLRPSPAGTPQTAEPGDTSPQEWARQQGLPEGIPEQMLTAIRQRYPDKVPDDIRERITAQLGG
jgi:hypothetical protein